MFGVVKLIPVPNKLPAVGASYQLMVPADAVAPKATVPASHLDAGVVLVIVGIDLIVTTVPDEVAEQAPTVTVTE